MQDGARELGDRAGQRLQRAGGPAAVDTPARTTCAAPPATPATTSETPGIFTRHPSITSPAPNDPGV
ncbi:hypothetical protein I548_2489 [Mycobacterium intracellulare]|nr:hypothetical protein I548_2489 [Mycobacterium intracellulare]